MPSSSARSIASTGAEADSSAEWTGGPLERSSWLGDKLAGILHTMSSVEEKYINYDLLLGSLLTVGVESESTFGQMVGTAASATIIGEAIRPELHLPPHYLSLAAGIGHIPIMLLRDSFTHPVNVAMADLFVEILTVGYPELLTETLADLVSAGRRAPDRNGVLRTGLWASLSQVSVTPDAVIRRRYRRRSEETNRLHTGSVTTLARLQAQSAELAETERLRGSQQQFKTSAHRKRKLSNGHKLH